MNIQFKKDSLELLILLIIRKSDQYGYSLIQLIKKKVEISEGTIYPLLRKMVKEGYFECYYQPSNEGPARKYYRITSSGIIHLNNLIEEWKTFTQAIDTFMKESDFHE